jgi:hypothetical protein
MITTLLEAVETEVNLRMPDLIRAILSEPPILGSDEQCVHMMVLEYLEKMFEDMKKWLEEEACYELGGGISYDDYCKFSKWCNEVWQAQHYARTEEPACDKCYQCRIKYRSDDLLDFEPEHFLRVANA